ncbi:hypothetical protein EDC90_101763 [Martelella mediterranea]|uniref:Uncharacterized protein n=1 Tax=Martelella mediterranea TaxID=293089 RepID=A0A4R3NP32_9HYPH|nr:hypothetical protein EDC90_101763 [Martelella mediterranea]
MLSDTMRNLRKTTFQDDPEMTILLHMFEMEAREMENRIFLLSGRPHVPLDGMLITPTENGSEEVKHG